MSNYKMTTEQVTDKFDKLSNKKKVNVLFDAIDYMQQYNGRSISECICLAMGYELHNNDVEGYVWEKQKTEK